ncbi:uncharacterized protein AC631_03938 [Debaryomyces fabryi]|uniref:Uncharacterized protein n=1 Tax=Debaryomyces fabryi TaxID=58627 RepID=A0A0V1PVL2_9ASCO|nr:uncharacterized protein AC631_03938 [Debaryomyces fabryi]KSA00324.1 hypothetical protein AC631_03938 [Debaryomyces fabryi]
MSKYNNSFSFLLNTENIEPLLELVNKLSRTVEQNAEILNRLTHTIDNDFRFPDLPIDIENTPPIENETDPLRQLLNQKYKLDDFSIKNEIIDKVTNPRIKELLLDNEKLNRLQISKKKTNTELYGIVKDYEMFILETMLPSLRRDIEIYRQEISGDVKVKQIPLKFAASEKLWSRYVTYIAYLDKLSKLCKSLMHMLEETQNNKEVLIIEQKLISINELKLNLQKRLAK